MFESFAEPPVQEEHVHLETEINKEANDESCVQARKARSAEATWERRAIVVARCDGSRPQLATVLAFPCYLVFTPLKLHNHENGPNGANNDNEWPCKFANSCPYV